jgi:hypothetical protein
LFSLVIIIIIIIIIADGSRDSSVGIVFGLRAGRPRNCDLIPGRGKRYFFPPKRSDRLFGPPSLRFRE